MGKKYFTSGSESEPEGLLIHESLYNNGEMIIGPSYLYKKKEITRDEYEEYKRRFNDPSQKRGLAGGLINEVGIEKLNKMTNEVKERDLARRIEENETSIALVVKKIKKLLQLEIIEQEDIDTEIGLNNMTEFKDEIKRRLEQ